MNKALAVGEAIHYCGIDVSAETLEVAIEQDNLRFGHRSFDNRASGHKELVAWLQKRKALVRVSLEATGVYSLDLALALHAADGIEVAVLNPKIVHRFAETLRRSKTDAADAEVLADYTRRMPFVAWSAPSQNSLHLRAVSRYVDGLTVQHTRENNRLHAAQASVATHRCVIQDLKRSLASIERRIHKLRREALLVVRSDESIRQRFDLLIGIPGIAAVSAIQILSELLLLPPNLTAREWVAHSGLDPAHQVSGTSVRKPSRISRAGNRHLRRALYMPALVAVRLDPHLKDFYERLIGRHKARLQALVAVSRKLLHAIYGIFRTQTPYEGQKLFPALVPIPLPSAA